MTEGVRRLAPAKINLCLRVVGRRADGYHLLDSLVAFTELGDTVEAAAADTLSLALDGPRAGALAAEPDNLVLRAARALSQASGAGPGARLTLTKRLPVSSGIGGGSADAAATLHTLCALWAVEPAPAAAQALAVGLGADVWVCLTGRPTRMRGIGEQLDPLPRLPAVPILLVNPGVAVATPAVFKARTGGFSPPLPDWGSLATAADVARLVGFGNDLAAPAQSLCPPIGTVLAALAAQPGALAAAMSGSGATCFALFATDAEAAAAAAAIQRAEPGWWVAATRLRPAG